MKNFSHDEDDELVIDVDVVDEVTDNVEVSVLGQVAPAEVDDDEMVKMVAVVEREREVL